MHGPYEVTLPSWYRDTSHVKDSQDRLAERWQNLGIDQSGGAVTLGRMVAEPGELHLGYTGEKRSTGTRSLDPRILPHQLSVPFLRTGEYVGTQGS